MPALLLALLISQTLVSAPGQLQKLSPVQARLLIDAGQVTSNAATVESWGCTLLPQSWDDDSKRWHVWLMIDREEGIIPPSCFISFTGVMLPTITTAVIVNKPSQLKTNQVILVPIIPAIPCDITVSVTNPACFRYFLSPYK